MAPFWAVWKLMTIDDQLGTPVGLIGYEEGSERNRHYSTVAIQNGLPWQ
jgi:hypothetical protein